MKGTYLTAALLAGLSFLVAACDDSGGGGTEYTAGEGIAIDNQNQISVKFGTDEGEVAAGNDPRFHDAFTSADLQSYLDDNGYTPGAGYGDADVQSYLDTNGYSPGVPYTDLDVQDYLDTNDYHAGPHVTAIDGLAGGTVQGNVTVTGSLTVQGAVSFPGQGLMLRRMSASIADEFAVAGNASAVVHTFAFTTNADPLVTGFVIEGELLHEPSQSGGVSASFTLDGTNLGSISSSWDFANGDPADTWVAKRTLYTQNLPLTGTDHAIEVKLNNSYGGASGSPQGKVRNLSLKWFSAD